MSKRNKKRSTLKRRKRRINYNGIKAGQNVMFNESKYKVMALKKNGALMLDNGQIVLAKECEKIE